MTWKDVYRRAFELALDTTDVGAGAEQLLAMDVPDRADFDAARFHYEGQLADYPRERELQLAIGYIREAMLRGDVTEHWQVWGHFNPWNFLSYRFAA